MLVLDDIYPAMIAISILGRHIICNRYHMADMHHKIFPPTRFPIRRSTQDPGRRSDILHPVTGYLNEPQEVQTCISRCAKLHALNYHCNIWDYWFTQASRRPTVFYSICAIWRNEILIWLIFENIWNIFTWILCSQSIMKMDQGK